MEIPNSLSSVDTPVFSRKLENKSALSPFAISNLYRSEGSCTPFTTREASFKPKSLKLNGFFFISPLCTDSSTIPIMTCSGSCLPEIIL